MMSASIAIKERPILFTGPMVRALLDGSKTQTRRIVKERGNRETENPEYGFFPPCPYGQPGHRLWVRETWLEDPEDDGTWHYTSYMGCKGSPLSDIPRKFQKPEHCIYREGWDGVDLRWRPSIHMPRWASRILLKIVSVRVERLHNISEADAEAEGVAEWARSACAAGNPLGYTSVGYYSLLWNQINGAESWDANPWVWVIEFQRVEGVHA